MERLLLAGWALLLATPSVAQTTTAPAITNAPASAPPANNNAIGPQELQNFSLPGTAVKPVEQQPATTAPAASSTQPQQSAPASAQTRRTATNHEATRQPAPAAAAPLQQTKTPTVALAPPPMQTVTNPAPQQVTAPPPQTPVSSATIAPQPGHRLPIIPWLIAALVLAGAIGFFLWRRRPREALAGPQFDLFATPEPTPKPAPTPAPAPRPAPQPEPAFEPQPAAPPIPRGIVSTRLGAPVEPEPAPRGIVASRLRPSVEIGVRPLRCLVEDSQVTIEFELELFNSGTAPARAVLAEASLINASATQDQELAAFFSRPAPPGGGLDAIPPMKRLTMTSQVVAPRSAIQEYDLGGHKTFVPVIAFNALYEWSGGKGQTSSAYLVGRETNGDKLGPLWLDGRARDYRTLGARLLPTGVRR